jgi:protein phosphatase
MVGIMDIVLPAGSLVVLIGVSGSGKSTFAERHFRSTEILSSDAFRAIVADDPADQRASRAAFELLHLAARRRLERRRLTVVDATNVTRLARGELLSIARAARRPAVAIVLDPPFEICLARNAARDGRSVDVAVIRRQSDELRATLDDPADLRREGFAAVHVLAEPLDGVTIVRPGPSGRRVSGKAGTATGTIAPERARRPAERRTAR